jgi:MFS transporter, DHA2 family, multidrug resistance protein
MGLTMPTAEDVVLSSVEPGDAGVGAGANSTNLQLGGSVGVALIGSIAITTYRHHLARLANFPPAALHAARPSLYAATATADHLPGGLRRPFLAAASDGFSQGLHTAFLVGASVAFVGAVAVARMRSPRPPGPLRGEPTPRPSTHDSENMP